MEYTFLRYQQEVAFLVHGDATLANIDSQFLDHIKRSVNRALQELTNRVKFQQLRKNSFVTLLTNVSTYDLPARCTGIVPGTLYFENQPGTALGYMGDVDWTLSGQQSRTTTGAPEVYDDRAYNTATKRQTIIVRPTPSASENTKKLYFQYYESVAEMTANGDIPPLPEHLHSGLTHGAIWLGFSDYIVDKDVLALNGREWQKFIALCGRYRDPVFGRRRPMRSSMPSVSRFGDNVDWPTS